MKIVKNSSLLSYIYLFNFLFFRKLILQLDRKKRRLDKIKERKRIKDKYEKTEKRKRRKQELQ